MVVETVAQVLRRLGYQVEAMTSSAEALTVFGETPDAFDLVITDQVMPEMKGDALVRKLRALSPHVPIIICTGYHKALSEKMLKRLGVSEIVLKPIDPVGFPDLVRRVLDAQKI
jgi:CheY-like chemotaxis protein